MMAPVRPQDREMDCEELKLEINDAVFVKKEAQENRGLRLGNILWPFGYLATFLSARQAIQLADKRIAYLQSIFRVKDCSAGRYRYE